MESTALVVENDPTDDIRRLGGWLTDAGLQLEVKRPYAGEELPETLDGYAALIVLGGAQSAYQTVDWFPRLESLLRKAVRHRVPTLGICLGGQLLAQALGGRVEQSPSGLEIGAKLVAKRDIAAGDPLFGPIPFAPDVIQHHSDEITILPAGAVLLAASTHYPHQAFRAGDRAWGIQFHIETDTETFAAWTEGLEGAEELVAEVDERQEDVREVWQPFARRFADLALGKATGDSHTHLPLIAR
ncbi:MAG TPA: type 1 glutamine amidotransferase [Candidatus Limnocylindrales bacterium]